MEMGSKFTLEPGDLSPVPCPGCSGHKTILVCRKDRDRLGLKTVACETCGLVFYNPMPTARFLENFYTESYRLLYRGAASLSARDKALLGIDERMNYSGSLIAKRVEAASGGAVLDYGCGDGSLLANLVGRKKYTRVYGIEPSDYARLASAKGIRILGGIDEIPESETFDLIILNHVFEHVREPLDLIRKLRRSLSEGGLVYLDVPDMSAYRSVGSLHLAHVLHFSDTSLQNIMNLAGFEIVDTGKHRPPNHPASIYGFFTPASGPTERLVPDMEQISAVFKKIERMEKPWRLAQAVSRIISIGKLKRLHRRYLYWRNHSSAQDTLNV